MEAQLNRTLVEKLGAILLFLMVLLLFGRDFEDHTIIGKSIFVISSIALLINASFILITPVAKIRGSILYLYTEVQPIIFKLKPEVIKLDEIINIEISKKSIEYRVIFSMSHNHKVYHGLPTAREYMVNRFMLFLCENTESEVIKNAYNNAN